MVYQYKLTWILIHQPLSSWHSKPFKYNDETQPVIYTWHPKISKQQGASVILMDVPVVDIFYR